MMRYNICTDNRRAIMATVLFHGALFLAFLAIPVRFRAEEQEKLYELTLMAVAPAPAKQGASAASPRETEALPIQRSAPPLERVEVPRRQMVEPEEPAITVPDPSPVEIEETAPAALNRDRERTAIQVQNVSPETKAASLEPEESSDSSKEVSEDTLPASGSGSGKDSGQGEEAGEAGSFRIEGDIRGRTVLYNPLPSYPEGLNRNATIRISFTVLPNGSVSPMGMIPVRKENSVLEELSMSMLKRWRFSPLSAGDTRNQRGIITFYYKVR